MNYVVLKDFVVKSSGFLVSRRHVLIIRLAATIMTWTLLQLRKGRRNKENEKLIVISGESDIGAIVS